MLWLDNLEARGILSQLHQLPLASKLLEARRRERLGESARYLADRFRAHRPIRPRAAVIAAGVLMSGAPFAEIAGTPFTRDERDRSLQSRFGRLGSRAHGIGYG